MSRIQYHDSIKDLGFFCRIGVRPWKFLISSGLQGFIGESYFLCHYFKKAIGESDILVVASIKEETTSYAIIKYVTCQIY
jgi:hypothetical protein